ncbi:hypothetical protein Pmar_PMAR007145 [Perkinsus marinus ATCC 50983]|uniref:Peptidase A1 domain-containing protein n=1 Tax=Perkinsus marinus (strain ATCC 50983 / TXsc) TaxID=423536 RepID=C5KQB6_PERM5|nr:hypothetical protein Pmar_PMAR007145 [Perkinsus marinus ATCC 50983]EER13338.1 hypothetical protein Pmar_PMAR007145 [Perkinsus marinus ATCC 50983]|eukprot:XP_002781543.1 hypothetical protein Pmar_PMAR007145 [Perkinsus marinus ATCC 50983]
MHIISPTAVVVGALITLVTGDPQGFEVLKLRVSEGAVPLTLDGQALLLEASSGTSRSFVFYGPQYERMYGRGSCDTQYYGCYFCPGDNPCGDILDREQWEVHFDDGTYHYVEHNVTLEIGKSKLSNFTFGLVIYFPTPYVRAPMATLGLSFGRPRIPETFLDQLKRRGAITTLLYSVHMNEGGPGISGNLILGGPSKTLSSSPFVAFSKNVLVEGLKIAVPVRTCKVVDFRGKKLTNSRKSKWAEPGILDTGNTAMLIEEDKFEDIIDVTWNRMKKSKAHSPIGEKKLLLCKSVPWDGMAVYPRIRREALPYLPILAFQIGEVPHLIDIHIEPKHYVNSCEGTCCNLDISTVNEFFHPLVLGHPLFRAYDVEFDLTNERVYFSQGWRNSTSSLTPGGLFNTKEVLQKLQTENDFLRESRI